jgi:DNA polymerase (family 10)
VTPLASATEEEVYAKLNLAWVAPEAREDHGELDAGPLALVAIEDIRAELHAHTTASDGSMEIAELVKRAQDRGFHTIAVTDHSQSSTIARGLKPDRLRRHIDAVHEVGAKVRGIRVLAGSEVDILGDGTLDYDDELLAMLDIVVASPHAALTQDSAGATARLVRAISHPLVHVLGHPTGRLVNRRAGLSPDMAKLIAAAVEHKVALEVNSHWMRLDLRDTHVRQAINAGAMIAIDCDVHEPGDFDNLRFGVMTARRGWCTKQACVNTWPREKLDAWLKKGR